jgi:hypothetical protein
MNSLNGVWATCRTSPTTNRDERQEPRSFATAANQQRSELDVGMVLLDCQNCGRGLMIPERILERTELNRGVK